MTKYVEDLTKEVLNIMANNCGKHFNTSCKFTDEQLVKDTEEEIRKTIHQNLKLLFNYLSDTIPVEAQTESLAPSRAEPDDD